MKKFVLPEKWHVYAKTQEESKIIGKWFDQSEYKGILNPRLYEDGSYIGSYGGIGPSNVRGNTPGEKISFEDFVKYVVNQETDEINQSEDYNQILIKLLTNG